MFLPSNDDVSSRLRLSQYDLIGRHLKHCFDRNPSIKNNSNEYRKSVGSNSWKSMKNHFECNACGKLLDSKPHLQRHLRIHNREKSFKCNECGRAFKMRGTWISIRKLIQRDQSVNVMSVEKPTGRRPISFNIRKFIPKRHPIMPSLWESLLLGVILQ